MDDSSILHKALKPPPQMVSGSGSWLRLDTGREIIDACSGVGVSCLGYQDKSVASAVKAQLEKFAYSYSSAYSADPCEELAKEILEGHPGGLSKATFFCSGAEATEAALKTTIQYWKEKGRPQRTKFISRKHSYHGSTLGALSVSGHTERREPFAEWLSPNVSFVDPCYPFRGKPQDMSEEDYVFKLKYQLEAEFVRLGPENVAAFIVETISGSTLGCVPASPGYFRAVREVCDKYGALLILDEVMCGMGRTGTYHAWQQEEGFRGPDLQTVSKSLGGGFIPLSAVLIHERIVNAIRQGTGSLNHSQTFQSHPLACAAALEVQRKIKRKVILRNVQTMGERLQQALREIILPLLFVGDVRGRGLLQTVEFVADKKDKPEFSEHCKFSKMVVDAALDVGLYLHGTSGCSGPYNVQYVMIAPRYNVSEGEIDMIVERLRDAIQIAGQKLRRSRGKL